MAKSQLIEIPWTSRPPHTLARINPDNWLVKRGLVSAVLFDGPVAYDVFRNEPLTSKTTGALGRGHSGASDFDGTNDEVELGHLANKYGMTDGRGATFFRMRPHTTSTDHRFFSYTGSDTTLSGSAGIAATTAHAIQMWFNGGWVTFYDPGASWANEWHSVGFTYEKTNNRTFCFFDGVARLDALDPQDSDRLNTAGSYSLGAEYSTGDFGGRFDGEMDLFLMFTENLEDREHLSLHRNPWQIFEPARVPVFIPAGAPAAASTFAGLNLLGRMPMRHILNR